MKMRDIFVQKQQQQQIKLFWTVNKYEKNNIFSPTFFCFLYLKSAIKLKWKYNLYKKPITILYNFKKLIRNEHEKNELKYVFKIIFFVVFFFVLLWEGCSWAALWGVLRFYFGRIDKIWFWSSSKNGGRFEFLEQFKLFLGLKLFVLYCTFEDCVDWSVL